MSEIVASSAEQRGHGSIALILLITALSLVGLLVAGSAQAGNCQGECGPPNQCWGGCTIDSPCAVNCINGTCGGTATCSEHGPPVGEAGCNESFWGSCHAINPCPQCPPCPPSECPIKTGHWAVLEYFDLQGAEPKEVTVLAASTPSFAAKTVEEVLSSVRDPRKAAGGDFERRQRVLFRVAPDGGSCHGLRLHFDDEVSIGVPSPVTVSNRSILFAVESDWNGRIIEAIPLYSEDPALAEQLRDLLVGYGALVSNDGTIGPYQAFVALGVNRGKLRYMFGGGSIVPTE
jgi:hypothetical protein